MRTISKVQAVDQASRKIQHWPWFGLTLVTFGVASPFWAMSYWLNEWRRARAKKWLNRMFFETTNTLEIKSNPLMKIWEIIIIILVVATAAVILTES